MGDENGLLGLSNSPEDAYLQYLAAQGLLSGTNAPKWATQGLLGNSNVKRLATQGLFGGIGNFDWLGKGLLGNIW